MAEQPAQDRTEEATPKRIREAREKGDVARSIDLSSAVLMLSVLLLFNFTGESFLRGLTGIIRDVYSSLATVHINPRTLPTLVIWISNRCILIMGPVLILVVVIGLLVNYLQVGVNFAPKALGPNWERINPQAGLKRIFSTRGLVELIKGLLKIIIVGTIIYVYLADRVKAADYTYQRWEYKRKLRMTRQEVKDEYRQTEGNPELRSRVRQMQREMSRNRMMAEAARATVIITNPVHVAVALKYDEEDTTSAPEVVAKGQRKVAERIKEVARAHNIPIKESPVLAQALFKSCEIGDEIPYAYYKVVAEILAEIFWERYGRGQNAVRVSPAL